MFRSGVGLALVAAAMYCVDQNVPMPIWLARASTSWLFSLVRYVTLNKRGRSSSLVTRYRQDLIDAVRYSEVNKIRMMQAGSERFIATVRAEPLLPKRDVRIMLEENDKFLGAFGRTLEQAYKCASQNLEKTQAFGGPGAIKLSYLKVKRNIKDPKQAMRYHPFSPRFLRRIGIRDLGPTKNWHQRVPIFSNLTIS